MDISLLTDALAKGEWLLSLYTALALIALTITGKKLLMLVPALRQTGQLNRDLADQQVKKNFYNAVQSRNVRWAILTQVCLFGLILPFCLSPASEPWWRILLDTAAILMFYDFIYYLVHRFLFHDGGFGPGPLMWVHAVHHQQKNPCRKDSSYLHPLETCIGVGLFAGSIALLSWLMGPFHIVTVVISTLAFSQINQHNHDRMEVDHFPFKYLNHMAYMHHVHHARFTAGNFATISLLYDWMFGTYDSGQGWGKKNVRS